MTPKEGTNPKKTAVAILLGHPELLTLDPAGVRAIEEIVLAAPQFAKVWQHISAHPLGGDDGWATKVPIGLEGGHPAIDEKGEKLCQWRLSDETRQLIRMPLAATLQAARRAAAADGGAPAPRDEPKTPAGTGWALQHLPIRHGLSIPSLSVDPSTRTCHLELDNGVLRFLTVYVEFQAGGKSLAPSSWTSRLPAAVRDFLETDTLKYLAVLPSAGPVAGIEIKGGPVRVSFPLPDSATGARVSFGGLGLGGLQPVVDTAAAMLTAVLAYAVPAILSGTGRGLDKADWFQDLLADETIEEEVMAAGRFLATDPPATAGALLEALDGKIGSLLFGSRLAKLRAAIAHGVGEQALADAAPVLGWAENLLAAQLSDPVEAQVASRVLSSPATFFLDLVSLRITLGPDPRHGEWPDDGNTYRIQVTVDGAHLLEATGAVPPQADAPFVVTACGVPAGGRLEVTASLLSAEGWLCGTAKASAILYSATAGIPFEVTLSLAEERAPLTAATRYRHRRKLVYEGTPPHYRWREGAAPTVVEPQAPDGLRRLIGITLEEAAGKVGYAWQGGAGAGDYAIQNLGVAVPEAGLLFLGGFAMPASVAYGRLESSAATRRGTDHDFYLDPRTYPRHKRFHLRAMKVDGSESGKAGSWGAFYGPPSGMAVHPGGFVVACFYDSHTVQVLALPDGPVELARAPVAGVVAGPGRDPGSVQGPVAVTITSRGLLLVLETDNRRVQALDPYGNPVPSFAGSSPFLKLRKEDASDLRYLDLAAGPDGVIYVLSKKGRGAKIEDHRLDLYGPDGKFLSRTPGVAAARLVADAWGRLYTLNYEALEGPQGRIEPTVSQWIPSSPAG